MCNRVFTSKYTEYPRIWANYLYYDCDGTTLEVTSDPKKLRTKEWLEPMSQVLVPKDIRETVRWAAGVDFMGTKSV